MRRRAVLATRNIGKLRELQPLLEAHGWQAVTLAEAGVSEDVAEDELELFDSFEENALAKARYFARRTGQVVFADDSGLAVDALDGRPGVRSKRWSESVAVGSALDQVNNEFLQAALRSAAEKGRVERSARYVCAAACAWPDGECVRLGFTEGTLLTDGRGAGGFGYDPYFLSADLGITFAEATREAKATVSHRGRAFGALLDAVENVRGNLRAAVDPERR